MHRERKSVEKVRLYYSVYCILRSVCRLAMYCRAVILSDRRFSTLYGTQVLTSNCVSAKSRTMHVSVVFLALLGFLVFAMLLLFLRVFRTA